MDLEKKWTDLNFVAFDLETTGKYPLSSEICEMAAVKYSDGKIQGTFQALIKPKNLMNQEVINIHGITNEMVHGEPPIEEKIESFYDFCRDAILMAHHSPFDLGFLAHELERSKLVLPIHPVMCTSLLSRNVIKESPNHKLVTLAKFLNIDPGNSHRALDDAKACLEVGLRCMQRLGEVSMTEVFKAQGGPLWWKDFSVEALNQNEVSKVVIQGIMNKSEIAIVYQGGSKPGKERVIAPTGLVRGPGRDFVMATDTKEGVEKRYYLERITSARSVGQLSLL